MSKLNKSKSILNGKNLLVTVDIGKINNYGYYRLPDGSDIDPFEFYNSGVGFRKFWTEIVRVKERSNLEEIVVGLESTGCYGEPLLHFLMSKKGVRLVQINPMHTSRVKELSDNSPSKTDKKDPKVIADIICLGHILSVVIPEGTAAELRRMSHARERELSRRTALYNQIQDLIFIIFPEFMRILKDISRATTQYLLRHYPLPQQIVELGKDQLSEILRKVSRGQWGKEQAIALYRAAHSSGGIREGVESILQEIEHLLEHIQLCNKTISTWEARMSELLKDIECSPYILSIKGIGEVTVAGLIGEVGNFEQFRTIAELEKLAGLDLYEISSGKRKGNRHISKRGRSLMRKLLYFAALNTVRKGRVMYEPYQRYRNKGMPKSKALVAIMRRLLRVIFALVRNHCQYIPDYETTKKTNKLPKAA
jgi:transposase